jgi:hypothetical protein
LPVAADHGGIGFGPWVTFDETAQNAIAAWDGKEEVLILSTEVGSASAGKLLEFLPLPSCPKSIKEGKLESFAYISSLEDRNSNTLGLDTYSFGWGDYGHHHDIDIMRTETIGPHDITVVKISGTAHFSQWIWEFAWEHNLPRPAITQKLQSCVQDYVDRGIRFFVFDVIDLTTSPIRINPVVYTFDTPYLWYPLKVTRDTIGDQWRGHEISVFLVTGEKLRNNDRGQLAYGNLHGRSYDKRVSSETLYWISADVWGLFPEGAYVAHVGRTLEQEEDLRGLEDIGISLFDFEDPAGAFREYLFGGLDRALAPVQAFFLGPSVMTVLPKVAPEDLAGQASVLTCLMIFFSLVLGDLLFGFFNWLRPGLNRTRLVMETYALGYATTVFGLFIPYTVVALLVLMVLGLAFRYRILSPLLKRVKISRYRRLLRDMWKMPLT